MGGEGAPRVVAETSKRGGGEWEGEIAMPYWRSASTRSIVRYRVLLRAVADILSDDDFVTNVVDPTYWT